MGGRRFWGLDGLFSMPLPELSEDEWIEDPAEAGEEASLCTVDEDSDAAKEVQKFMDEVKAKCEASNVSPLRYASDTLSHTKPEFLYRRKAIEKRERYLRF
jgi:hypothetical protein